MKLLEKIFLGIVLLSFVLRCSMPWIFLPFAFSFWILGLFYLATGFWFLSYGKKKKGNYENNIGFSIGVGFILGTCCWGILFKLMCWPGAYVLSLYGVVLAAAIAIPIGIILFNSQNKKHYFRLLLIRLSVTIILGVPLLYASPLQIFSFFHNDDPVLVEKWQRHYDNPDDVAAFEDYYNYKESHK